MNDGEQDQKMVQIIGKTWSDEEFRRRLLANPAAVLRAEGLQIPSGVTFRVLEDTDAVFHLVLPVPPTASRELSDEELVTVAGGMTTVDPVYGRKTPTGTSSYS